MKITTRIATTDFSYVEAEFGSLAEYEEFYPGIKEKAFQERLNTPVVEDTPEKIAVALGLTPPVNNEVPFPSSQPKKPFGKATKVVGQPCNVCGTAYVSGVKGPYCKPCYVTWKNNQAA